MKSKTVSFFGGRAHGDARVPTYYPHLFIQLHLSPVSTIIPQQTHSTTIAFIDTLPTSSQVIIPSVDGLITNLPNITLTIMTADCVPITFSDAHNSLIGISHQGWKGSLNGLAQKMVQNLQTYGADIHDLQVEIGPSIGPCCYEFYGERSIQMQQAFSNQLYPKHQIFPKHDQKTYLDLKLLNYFQLAECGIPSDQIHISSTCTKCDKNYFSYQRDYATEDWGENGSCIMFNYQ